MAIYLNSTVKQFTHIVHIADIHIRLTKRHDEYQEMFEKLYKEIEKTPQSTLIAVLGDLFHVKSDLSPECVQLASNFLRTLADLRPTILVAGNHDATLNNKSRMDSLTPIVTPLKHNNLFYLNKSEIYIMGNLLLNNYCIFDDYTKYISYTNIPKSLLRDTDCHIALYHGPVQGAMTDVGYRVISKTVANESFDGHDIVLLGDIHKHQLLQEHSINYGKPVIVYAGSLIQQNHGEALEGHGYVLWDIATRDYTLVEIPNDYGYFTIEIEKGKLYTDVSKMPKKVTLRAKCNQTIPSEVKSLMAKLSDKHQLVEITYDKIDSDKDTKKNIIDTTNINLTSISTNVDYQNQLIKKFLVEKNPEIVTEDLLKQIFDINQDVNSKIEKELVPLNIRWKPKKFEFENMFSYGEGNVIDFKDMKGVIGLFANNASGKSSILSALSYCLFDKCDRAFKAVHVLNTQKMSFNCKFNFEIDGVNYFIERIGLQDKKGNVKVDVKFYILDKDNKIIDLNGEARRNTNDVIRDYIGTYEDFLLTVLSIQNSTMGNFIDMGQADRKDLIAKFMGITIYDQLDTIAKSESKEITTLLKNYSKTDYPKLLEQRIQEIMLLTKAIETEHIELDRTENKLKAENERLLNELSKVINVGNAPSNIDEMERQRNQLVKEQNVLTETNVAIKQLIDKLKQSVDEVNEKINTYDVEKLKLDVTNYNKYTSELAQLKGYIDKKTFEQSLLQKKLNELQAHKFNPKCDDCLRINNHYIVDIDKTRSELLGLETDLQQKSEQYAITQKKIESLVYVVAKQTELQQLKERKTSWDQKHNHAVTESLKNTNKLMHIERQLELLNSNINLYYKENDAIESNKEINTRITVIKSIISQLETTCKGLNKKISELTGKLTVANEQKTSYEETIKTAKVWEIRQHAYTYYLMAISRDGIPYNLIRQALPTIEKEINNILHQIVEFTIDLTTDGKSVIGHINYEGKRWPIEMGSGLEKFALSLAIRVALINISNLPRPNFMAIDEGFGCADKENLNGMSALLSHFKHTFDFVLVVSHLDAMKDMVDKQLEIKKEKGFSKIVVV